MSNLEYVGGQWNPVGTYRGPPPGGAVRPLLPTAGKPYDLNQWNQLPASKRGGFRDRASYLRWWKRVVEPKLTKPKTPAGQAITQNPHGGGPQATAAVTNPAVPKDPRELAIERQIAERQRYSIGQAEAAAKIMAALASVQSGEPGQIQAAYQGAADRTVDYAQGMTGELGAQAGSAAQQAAASIAAAGAPGTGIASESAAINNTLNYTGGYIPGTNLAAEAANQMTNALTQNKASLGRLAELGYQQMRDEAKEIEKLRYEAIDLQGTIAGEKKKDELDEREMQLRERAQRVNEGQLKLSVAKTAHERADALTDVTGTLWTVNKKGQVVNTGKEAPGTRAYSELQEGEKWASQSAQPDAALSKAYGFIVDANGNFIRGANGKKQPVAKTGAAAKKPISPATKSETLGRASSEAKIVTEALLDKIWRNTPKTYEREKGETLANYNARMRNAKTEYNRRLGMNVATVRAQVRNAVQGQLRTLGYNPEQITKWVNQYIYSHGFTPKDTSSQQRPGTR